MFRTLGTFKLPLAAKCELLFGAAVVLVIAAAVFVPWLRMEELTGQINENVAEAVVQAALDEHVAYHTAQLSQTRRSPTTSPVAEANSATQPTTLPENHAATQPSAAKTESEAPGVDTHDLLSPDQYGPTHLLLLSKLSQGSTELEKRAAQHFRKYPDRDRYWKLRSLEDNRYAFRYGKQLYIDDRCKQCHARSTDDASAYRTPFALATVEIPSQIDPNELLLNRMFIFAAALFAGTLAVIFFYLIISRLILEPVRVLQKTAEKVSEGDLNIRTLIPSGDEFQVLSETFNKMLQNLKLGEDQLRALNKSLDLKLEQLAESNLSLYESNRLKSEFLANVSHELRTPLNSILGFAELLKDPAKSDPKASRYVQNIASSGKSLLDLINDLLDLAKIEAGKMEVRAEPLSLSDLCEGLSNVLRPLLEQKSLAVDIKIDADVPLMHTDAAKLQQILYNFLSNAIKFSPDNAIIKILAQRHGEDRVSISVADTGPGILMEQQQLIFEKFRQIDGSHTRQVGGTGLGLAISRDLTRLLGGTIGVDSQPGQGATFWVLLPIKIESSTQDVRGQG